MVIFDFFSDYCLHVYCLENSILAYVFLDLPLLSGLSKVSHYLTYFKDHYLSLVIMPQCFDSHIVRASSCIHRVQWSSMMILTKTLPSTLFHVNMETKIEPIIDRFFY